MGRALRCKAKASLVKQGPLGLTLAGGGESEPLQEAGLGEWLLEAQLGGGAWTPPPGSPVSPALTACPVRVDVVASVLAELLRAPPLLVPCPRRTSG